MLENNESASLRSKLVSKSISLQESIHRTKLIPLLEDTRQRLKHQSKAGTNDSLIIDTDHVIYIENGPNYHTYTFRVIDNENPKILSNLVLTPLPDGSYKQLMFSYNFSSDELERLRQKLPVDPKGKVHIYDIGNTTIVNKGCIYAEETIWHECSEGIHDRQNLNDWGNCKAAVPPKVYTISYWSCGSEGTGGGGDGTGSGGDNGGGTGGSTGCEAEAFENPTDPTSGNGPCGGGVITEPNVGVNESQCFKIKKKFRNPRFVEKYDKINKPEIFDLDHETGAFERYPPKENNLPSGFVDVENYPGTTNMDLPVDKSGIVGLMHSHNNEDSTGNHPVKIFSPTDIRTFINHLMPQANSYTGSYTNAYSVVTTSNGNYMLQYNNNSWPGSVSRDTKAIWQTWYENQYNRLTIDELMNPSIVEKIFTQFIKEIVNIDGLEIYKITSSSASKLEYNGKNNPVISTPCP